MVRDRLVTAGGREGRRCSGAPFAEEGKMRAEANTCWRFSRMRRNQLSRDEEKGRRNGSGTDMPPRGPLDPLGRLAEARGERVVEDHARRLVASLQK